MNRPQTGRGRHQGTLRVEDAALVTGRGRFVDDLNLDRQVAGVFVRSPHPHAGIRGISVDEALRQPGVIAVLTAADVAGLGNVSRPPPQEGRDGRPLIVPKRPVLAGDRVVHVGEPVALVVAETVGIARDAADLVTVDYDPLPAVSDGLDALAAGAPEIWREAPGNMALDWPGPAAVSDSQAEVDRIIAEARHTVSIRVVNQRLAGVPLETRGATGVFDRQTGRYTLHAPSQSAHALKGQLGAILGVGPRELRVLSGDVGGAFGLKTSAYPEYAALLVAAEKVGRPVHWMSTRSEAFQSDNQGRDSVAEATLALAADGRFLALKVSAVVNLGAYVSSAGAIIATIGFANCFPTMYDIRHVSVGVRLAFTNTVPTGPYRGAGRPEANYVMERVVDAAARAIGADPVELRRRNLIAAEAMPYRSAVGNVYDSGDFAAVLAAAADHADIGGFAERRAEAAGRGRWRGIGVSCFLEHAGGAPGEGAALVFAGGRLIVRLGMQPSGQGHATLFRDLVARRLGVAAERVVVEQGDSDLPITGGPAVGSRSTNAAGAALVKGIERLVATACDLAAELTGADRSAVGYRDGYVEVAGTNYRVSLFDLADRLTQAGRPDALTTVVQATAVNTFPNGCHLAEVEIDPETGQVGLANYVAVDDCGTVLDHTLAESQVVGGVVQGLGQGLMELVVYDRDGQLLTGTLMDYAVPRAQDVPSIASAFRPTPCQTNALGVKGVGEAGATAAIAAVMNAIADAIPSRSGADIDMPATSERVWRACAAATVDRAHA
ncbi:MAG: xanthine dehydrogenase family protein molybdopterin-binding subunit [Bauldia sp.]